jgi:hypothetical protein
MPANMSWPMAKAAAKSGLHVRRATWSAGAWLIYQRGIAWFWTGNAWRVALATDFGRAEFNASDWTTIPPELAACPTSTGTGSGSGWVDSPGNQPGTIVLPKPGVIGVVNSTGFVTNGQGSRVVTISADVDYYVVFRVYADGSWAELYSEAYPGTPPYANVTTTVSGVLRPGLRHSFQDVLFDDRDPPGSRRYTAKCYF